MYDLIILGGGPAGLTSAMYAIRKRLNVLLDLARPRRQDPLPYVPARQPGAFSGHHG